MLLRARRAHTTPERFHLTLCTYITHGAAFEHAPGISSQLQPHSNGDAARRSGGFKNIWCSIEGYSVLGQHSSCLDCLTTGRLVCGTSRESSRVSQHGSRGRRDSMEETVTFTWLWEKEHSWVCPCKLVSLDYSKLNFKLLEGGGESTIQICSEGPLSSGAIILCMCSECLFFCVTG